MKAVLDTNVIVSSLIRPASPPAQITDAWRDRRFEPVTSPALLEELREVLARDRIEQRTRYASADQARFIAEFAQYAVVVSPAETISASADPDDNRVLEAAVAGAADYIVSGDHHLLDLAEYARVPIVTPARFLAILAAP